MRLDREEVIRRLEARPAADVSSTTEIMRDPWSYPAVLARVGVCYVAAGGRSYFEEVEE